MDLTFFDWSILGTMAGAVAAVGVLTQLTKNIPGIKNMPTQIWSYILAAVVLVLAQVFGDVALTISGVVLALINAAVVSLAANGAYQAITRKPVE